MSASAATELPFALNAAKARAVFEDLRSVCDADASELWGVALYGPMLLVDPSAGVLGANQPAGTRVLEEDGGVVIGPIPEDLMIANTTVELDGVRWSMVLWPVPSDPETRMTLLVHEAWHRVQSVLGIPAASAIASHLEEMDARVSLRMELSSLTDALQEESVVQARCLLARALMYRGERRTAHPDGAASEDELERSEGLAEYTGRKLGHSAPEAAVAEALSEAAGKPSFIRSFAYFTGPALGLLLDRLTPGWRSRVLTGATLSQLTTEAVSGTSPAEPDLALRKQIEATERRRDEDRAQRNRRWLQLLVTGPTLRLPISHLQTVFDPGALIALGEHGTVYPSVKLTDRWGHVEVVDSGALIDPEWKWISMTAIELATDGEPVTGRGWKLTLNAGWSVCPSDGGHEVVRDSES